jgi:S-adenosylmethionine:tRNA ribosyltransferase-isomerase
MALLKVDDFDFALDERLIALYPAEPRDAARLLRVAAGEGAPLVDAHVRDLPGMLAPGDVLVLNDTRVIPAALSGFRPREGGAGARIEVILLEPVGEGGRWRALARPARRLRPGDRIRFGGAPGRACELGELWASVEARGADGEVGLAFDLAGPDLERWIEDLGAAPLPPYIAGRRPAEPADLERYQTVYARRPGAVAAPTAGLHFTPALLARIAAAGIQIARLTLHVGAGTFLPVKADDTSGHVMHAERGELSAEVAEALNRARARGGRIVAVGTTSARLLEAAADPEGRIAPFAGATDIFITPGYRFRAVDLMLTNFHLPRSTLFMLVAAFSGLARMRAAYAHAMAARYRFYSYGDACLLERAG